MDDGGAAATYDQPGAGPDGRQKGAKDVSVTRIGYDDPIRRHDHVRWSGWMDVDGHRRTVRATFTCPDPFGFVPSVRPFVLAFLVPAMTVGRPIHLGGPIDEGTAAGLAEWQEALASQHVGLRAVPVVATRRAEAPPRVGAGGLTAFSGGVDSCFTAVRGRRGAEGGPWRAADLTAGLMVHGFDIPATDMATFGSAYARSRRMLRGLGLHSYALRTDVRRLEVDVGCDWETQTHGIWLAFALSCLEQWFARTVVPSTYPYDQQRLPWASTPQTDPLLGSEARPLWHDGAAFDKLGKVAALAPVPAVVGDLRVCWQGEALDRNCGRCFKCVVTQVCFWISGIEDPASFEVRASVDDLAAVRLSDPYKVRLGRRMHAAASEAGRDDVANAVETALITAGASVDEDGSR